MSKLTPKQEVVLSHKRQLRALSGPSCNGVTDINQGKIIHKMIIHDNEKIMAKLTSMPKVADMMQYLKLRLEQIQ